MTCACFCVILKLGRYRTIWGVALNKPVRCTMKNDRLFQLVYLLLEKSSMNAPILAKELEVSVRTVYRDVESLSMAGVPIYTTIGKNGVISLAEGYSFDKTLLSYSAHNQLLLAVQRLKSPDQQVYGLLS